MLLYAERSGPGRGLDSACTVATEPTPSQAQSAHPLPLLQTNPVVSILPHAVGLPVPVVLLMSTRGRDLIAYSDLIAYHPTCQTEASAISKTGGYS